MKIIKEKGQSTPKKQQYTGNFSFHRQDLKAINLESEKEELDIFQLGIDLKNTVSECKERDLIFRKSKSIVKLQSTVVKKRIVEEEEARDQKFIYKLMEAWDKKGLSTNNFTDEIQNLINNKLNEDDGEDEFTEVKDFTILTQ
jgi:hypothetical protein